MNKVHNRLRQLRVKSMLTQKQFALKLGISQQQFHGYESGIHRPGIDILTQLRIKFGADLNWLVAGDLIGGEDVFNG